MHPNQSRPTTKLYAGFVKFLGSTAFLWAIVGLFVLQALWVAISFGYPLPYDEGFHLGLIKIYSHHLSPIIANQPPSYDAYRGLFHEGSHLYHYVLSFPYRLIGLFAKTEISQVITLRVINIVLFAGGLVFFSKLFRRVGIRQSIINVALLFLIFLPMTSLVAATINYDNMLFLLTPVFLIYCAKIIAAKKVAWQTYASVIIIGCAASLVQFQFLPLFAVAVIYLAVLSWRRYGKKFLSAFKLSVRKSSRFSIALVAIPLIIFVGLFSQVYIADTIRYGSPVPSCTVTMGYTRCMESTVISGYQHLLESKDRRPIISLPDYSLTWIQQIGTWVTCSAARNTDGVVTAKLPLPVVYFMVFAFSLGGVAVLLYAWRSMPKNKNFYFLAICAVGLTAAVFMAGVAANYRYNKPAAIQPRYLLPILPILMVLLTLAFDFVLHRVHIFKSVLFIVTFMAFVVAGGGVSTHILLSQDNWYLQQPKVIRANHIAKKIIGPLTKQSIGRYGL